MNKIKLSDFIGADDRALFSNAIEYMKRNPGTTLFVEPRIYNITTEKARNAQKRVMDGSFTANPQDIMFKPEYDYDIGLDFSSLKDCSVDAEGATLLIDGFMEPIAIRECEDTQVCGFTVLHKRKPYSKGRVLEVSLCEDGLWRSLIEFDSDCPVLESTPFSLRVLFYDEEKKCPYYTDFKKYEYIDSHHIYSYDASATPLKAGLYYYTCHTYHSRPAVMIENSKRITLQGITVHNNCGMGFLGHRCDDLTLDSCKVTPIAGDRTSTNTDASHFTSIKGELKLINCLFEFQGDDFSNIHGYYHKILKKDGECSYIITDRTPTGIHAQVFDYPDIGDTMELCDLSTLKVFGEYKVTECEPMYQGKWQARVTFDRPLSEGFEELFLTDITRLPKLTVSGCSSFDHYARSLVVKTRDVLIENCHFKNIRETAITAYAEPFWGEGASPANVTIRNCRFENCCWIKNAPSAILASVPVHKEAANAVKNITVENNYIYTDSCDCAMRFANVDGVFVKGNTILCRGEAIKIEECTDVTIES